MLQNLYGWHGYWLSQKNCKHFYRKELLEKSGVEAEYISSSIHEDEPLSVTIAYNIMFHAIRKEFGRSGARLRSAEEKHHK